MRSGNEGVEEEETRRGHEILQILLDYLPSVFELVSFSCVCRSLRDATRHETSLWANLVVDVPFNLRLSDEILSEIASRAAGKLKSLTLRRCPRITDAGIRRVVDANPLITTIVVPDCMGLTPEGIISAVQSLTQNNHELKTLHVNGICGFNKHHLSVLRGYLPSADIDVEICPKCDEVMMIPWCSRESCLEQGENRRCRACRFCIPRCVECAVCVGPDEEDQETACGDVVCLECWLLPLQKCSYCNKPFCTRHTVPLPLQQNAAAAASMADYPPMPICETCCHDPYDHFDL